MSDFKSAYIISCKIIFFLRHIWGSHVLLWAIKTELLVS